MSEFALLLSLNSFCAFIKICSLGSVPFLFFTHVLCSPEVVKDMHDGDTRGTRKDAANGLDTKVETSNREQNRMAREVKKQVCS